MKVSSVSYLKHFLDSCEAQTVDKTVCKCIQLQEKKQLKGSLVFTYAKDNH